MTLAERLAQMPTPETDASTNAFMLAEPGHIVSASFARSLERRLALAVELLGEVEAHFSGRINASTLPIDQIRAALKLLKATP